jgi:hypothetical protein
MEEILIMTSTVGFPIAVCIYLLIERNKEIKSMNKLLTRIETLIMERL